METKCGKKKRSIKGVMRVKSGKEITFIGSSLQRFLLAYKDWYN